MQEEHQVDKSKKQILNEESKIFSNFSKKKIRIRANENPINKIVIPKGNMEINNNYNIEYEAPVQILNFQFPINRNVTPLKDGKFQKLKIRIDVSNNNKQTSQENSQPLTLKTNFAQSQKNFPITQEQTETTPDDICRSKTKETRIETEKQRLINIIKNRINLLDRY